VKRFETLRGVESKSEKKSIYYRKTGLKKRAG